MRDHLQREILCQVQDEDLLDDYDLVVHPLLGTATYLTDAGQESMMNMAA